MQGDEHVDKAMASLSPTNKLVQEWATAHAWGTIWTRPGLELKQRSMINIAMLTALSKFTELAGHIRGGLTNGLTEDEIREILLQAAGYCGFPFVCFQYLCVFLICREWRRSASPIVSLQSGRRGKVLSKIRSKVLQITMPFLFAKVLCL
jgi:4-carboxymuconolactone decarboxylase